MKRFLMIVAWTAFVAPALAMIAAFVLGFVFGITGITAALGDRLATLSLFLLPIGMVVMFINSVLGFLPGTERG